MGDHVRVPPSVLRDAVAELRGVREALDDLDDLTVDAAALGDPSVAAAAEEAQRGWHLHRARLRQQLGTLAVYVDAVVETAEDLDASIVTGDGG